MVSKGIGSAPGVKKKPVANLALLLPAGKVTLGPKIASALGPKGVNMPKFCEAFNQLCSGMIGANIQAGDPVTCKLAIFSDKSFEIEVVDTPVQDLLKVAAGITKGGSSGNFISHSVGSVTSEQVRAIAERKMKDIGANSLEAAIRAVVGTARSIKVVVVD